MIEAMEMANEGQHEIEDVYIAGPIGNPQTAEEQLKLRVYQELASSVEGWLVEHGYAVKNPYSSTMCLENFHRPLYMWYAHGLKSLMRCDAIVLLPGWRDSQGAQLEHEMARAWGIRRFEWDAEGEGGMVEMA